MRVLITGVSGFLGQGVVARLIRHNPFKQVIGIDRRVPRLLGPVQFMAADLRTADLGDLLATHGVDAVLHLAFAGGTPTGRDELHVASRLVQAAELVELERLVMISRDQVYAPSAVPVSEDAPIRSRRGLGGAANARLRIEERVAQAASSATPDSGRAVVMVRLGPVLGVDCGARMEVLLRKPALLGARGIDPLVQLIDLDDVSRALIEVTLARGLRGAINIGGSDPLPLSVVAGVLEKPFLRPPDWVFRSVVRFVGQLGVADLSRGLISELYDAVPLSTVRAELGLGYRPRLSTRQTLAVWRTGYVRPERIRHREETLTPDESGEWR